MRICFVGQTNYFLKQIEHDLDDMYEIIWQNITFGNVGKWTDLLDVEADVFIFFLPHSVPKSILDDIRGVKVAKHAEPLPKFVNGIYFSSPDLLTRLNELLSSGKFDHWYHHDKTSIPVLEREGFRVKEFLSPIATGTYYPESNRKVWDVFFVGKYTAWRTNLLVPIKHQMCGNILHVNHGLIGNELREVLSKVKIGLNLHTENLPALEDRLQIYMACKVFVLSQPLSHHDFFVPNMHFAEFINQQDLWDKIQFYLTHDDEREAIAQAGYELVVNHLSARKKWPELIDEVIGSTI